MEPITLTGAKITDARYMKQSKLMRYTIELTENDTKKYAPSMAVLQTNDFTCRVTLTPDEIEGENNGFEYEAEQIDKKAEKQEKSIYSSFRNAYILAYGAQKYDEMKKRLGVEHLDELPVFVFEGLINQHKNLFTNQN